jgi:D-sedoheptulose 7-phosphate isomerase
VTGRSLFSAIGNLPNLVKAVKWCRVHQVHTIAALVSGNRGRLASLADEVLVVDDTYYGRVEDFHMHIAHMICYAFIDLENL